MTVVSTTEIVKGRVLLVKAGVMFFFYFFMFMLLMRVQSVLLVLIK